MLLAVFSALRIKADFKNRLLKTAIVLLPVISILLTCLYVVFRITDYYELKEPEKIDMSLLTQSGNSYTHYPAREDIENGYFVWRYINEEELRTQWENISEYDYDGTDNKGHLFYDSCVLSW